MVEPPWRSVVTTDSTGEADVELLGWEDSGGVEVICKRYCYFLCVYIIYQCVHI